MPSRRKKVVACLGLWTLGLATLSCRYIIGLSDRAEGQATLPEASDDGEALPDADKQGPPKCNGLTDACVPESCKGDGAVPGDGTTVCGEDASASCCAVAAFEGGTYNRFEVAHPDGGEDGSVPSAPFTATVGPFVLDRFEVTIGRFEKYISSAGFFTSKNPPPQNAGGLPTVVGRGWSPEWSSNLASSTTELRNQLRDCSAANSATTGPYLDGDDKRPLKPITCVSWYDAFAFCIWDGGRLPTEAEWNYVASAGGEQRYYPWSSPPENPSINQLNAAYCSNRPWAGGPDPTLISIEPNNQSTGWKCNTPLPRPQPVGKLWRGNAIGDVADMGGNAAEWMLDTYVKSPVRDCVDNCLETSEGSHVIRGGTFQGPDVMVRNDWRQGQGSANLYVGFRCARDVR
jgi:formylglycine-generating enzyme required for sulfatase activity